jgi:hypothetical protein
MINIKENFLPIGEDRPGTKNAPESITNYTTQLEWERIPQIQ